ncbi:D-mandelate [Pleurostoma richardsiae]|uniref:D-mandelate n=1 Tax=Pleurostoma richardsiae TaxID=41990 RepID=A0AA38RQ48_9PEZI|nr:D-mandelate [Pleurostoma richardsiae]
MADTSKPIVLHLGDPIKHNKDLYAQLSQRFTVIRPSTEERQRPAFLEALRTRKWGDFSAIMRPFWSTGGEMGRWDAELVPLLPRSLKVFASAGAGYDWADVDLLAEAGVLYCNGASASSEAVADMAVYHIISVFRNMQWTNMAARARDPAQFLDAHHNSPFTAHNPRGHVLGVIGLGNIGYTIAQKAYRAFGMKIIYYDPFPKSAEQEAAIEARRVPELNDMLAEADCVVLAAPGGGGKIIDAERLTKMKKGARLVNIARGSLVDTDAVADSMEAGHLFAVGLDVHEDEPNVNPRLVGMRNATLTCHTAGGALETNIGFERLSIENVMAVLAGKPPLTPVNKHLMKA